MNSYLTYFYLQHLTAFSHKQLLDILSLLNSPDTLLETPYDELLKKGISMNFTQIDQYERFRNKETLLNLEKQMHDADVCFVPESDDRFPSRLNMLSDPPFGIFVKGSLPAQREPTVGIIGSRACSVYGKEMAWFFGKELASGGLQIVSGMALGVDGYAQRGAVSVYSEGAGKTFGVLAGGVDICYPKENIRLYKELTENGHGLISEKPLNSYALPRDFPIRNRIIAALSDALIVIEAAENSGSLITVNQALSLGKDIFVLPGRVGDRQARGSNDLIKSGAFILTSPEDVLQYFGKNVQKDTLVKSRAILNKEEKTVYDCFGTDPLQTDDLLQLTHFPLSSLQPVLLQLEIKGLIKKAPFGGFIKL